MTKTIPVFYTITDNYTPYAGVSIQSLIDHASFERDYTVYVLVQEISPEHQKALEDLSTKNVHVKIFHIDDKLLQPFTDRQENYLRGQFFTLSIFYRLFIPELFPQYDKGIYLDADTIVNTDLGQLYDTAIGNNMFGACSDLSIRFVPLFQEYITECHGIKPADKYINNGVLLFNLKAFRDKKFINRFLYLLNKYHFDNIDPDQAYMNDICEDYIYHLAPEWDAMPNENLPEIQDPKIIHYNLFFKPWHFEDVQYGKYFWKVAKKTTFYPGLKDELANFTDEQRQKERDDLDKLINKIHHIKKTTTWALVKNSGENVKL